MKEIKKEKKVKKSFVEKLKHFVEEHTDEIILVGMAACGAILGFTVGNDVGHRDSREKMREIMAARNRMVDLCGMTGCFSALDAVEEQIDDVNDRLDWDELGRSACRHYYETPEIKELLKS